MFDDTLHPGEFSMPDRIPDQQTAAVSPFDDIASVHALYEQRIFRFLLLSLRDRDVALSLTQDTFLKAWRSRDSFRGDCSIATWLTRIAINLVRDHTRTDNFRFWKKAHATAIDADELKARLPHPSASAETDLIARERLTHIWEAVETLSSRQRTIFLLRFVDELELNEIAEITALPLPTVKSHLYRALDKIRASHTKA
jgi:RNA polymerase sigma-70 factor (ECF subfamily)